MEHTERVFNLKEYRKAKILVQDLEVILKVVNLSIKSLEFFKMYNSVKHILTTLKEEKIILESNLKKYKEILNNKGKVNENS